MATQWIIKTDAEPAGPFDLHQMQSLVASEQLLKTHHVKRVGSDEWREAGRVMAFWSASNSAAVATAVTDGNSSQRGRASDHIPPVQMPGVERAPRRRPILWTLLKAGLVFGPVAGQLVYDLRVYLGVHAYQDPDANVDMDGYRNYFSVSHWEHLLVGLLVGVVFAFTFAIMMKRDPE